MNGASYILRFTFNVVVCLGNKLLPVITYVTATINSDSLCFSLLKRNSEEPPVVENLLLQTSQYQ